MLSLCPYIVLVVTAIYLIVIYIQKYKFKKKLWWVQTLPGYPVVGVLLKLQDSTTILEVLRGFLTECNGLGYCELGPLWVLFASDNHFLKWMLSSNLILTKSDPYKFMFDWLGGGILISTGEEWRRSRKILTPAFHFSILEQFIEIFEDATKVLVRILNQEVDKDEVDIHPFITRYTLDVVCRTSMGVQLNLQEQGHINYVDAVAGMGKIIMARTLNPLKAYKFIYRFTADYRREKKFVKLLHQVSDSVIKKRKQEIEHQEININNVFGKRKKMAFLDLLLTYRDENGQALSYEFIRHEVDTIMFEGHDTTAAALGFAMYLLAKHSDAQAEAYTELKQELGKTSKITIKNLQNLKYLDMVIKETLRLYPSVPFYARKITEDLVYDGNKMLPKGLTVIVCAYVVNRDSSVYDKPDEFIPTRFRDNEPKPFSNLPFSSGPRNCIGQRFAMLELKMALAMILLNFKLLPAKSPFEPIVEAVTILKSQNGIKIRLEKRNK